jgi:hypothetical protein
MDAFLWFGVTAAAGTAAISDTHDRSNFDSLGNPKPFKREELPPMHKQPAYACDYGYSSTLSLSLSLLLSLSLALSQPAYACD